LELGFRLVVTALLACVTGRGSRHTNISLFS
jgi:hypothetical protein